LDSYLDPATVNTTWFTYTYSTDGGTNYSPLTSSVTLATAVGTTTYTLRAQNTLTGSLEEATTDVVITVNPAVAIGTDLNTTKVTETINLSPIRTATLTVVATGTGYTYQWYKSATNAYAGTAITDGTAYAGATTEELTITFNTTDITGFYYLVVTDACGNTVNSAIKEIEAIDKPDDVVLLTTTDNRKACLLTDAIPVEFTYSNTYSNGETIWYNNADDTSTAYPYTVGSSTIVLNSWGDNTIYVWAKNPGASGNFSDQADTYTINLTQYTAVTLANIADIELEAAAGANATATITATASGDADPLSGAYTYSLYAGTNPTAVDGPTAATGANTFAGQSVAAPALTYTTADHLAYTFKVVATGACSPAAEKTVNVKVYPTPVVTLDGTKDVAFCNATAMTINLWNYLDTPNAVLFDYEYSEDGTTYNSLASSTTVSVPANGTAKTIKLRAKNKKATPTVSTAVDLSLTVNVPVTALAFDPAVINLEGATSTTITVPVPTVGTKDASGNYNYILYNSDNTPAASTQTTNVFTSIALTAPLTTESHSSQSYYATIQGASTCNAVPTPNNVTVNVYPVPTLSLATTTDAYCEDN
ncbi:hypothetical protein D0T51_11740, partial [Parabacteroides sp. 52]|uniref:hypothetical protein n=1 Tax=Parabacteroides sp. 52 TaxID=2302940 RepID=UPI0013D36E5C